MTNRIITILLLAACTGAAAQHGDPARGKPLTGACTGCHQSDGNGRENWPRLAGLPADYLVAQLAAYKNGSRPSASMKPFAMMLDDGKMADIAAYFAGLPPAAVSAAPPADPAQLARGKTLAESGDATRDIPPCTQCHGADLRGDGNIPGISAQPAAYLRAQISAWQQGDRPNDSADPKGMFQTARRLNDEDSAAVAAYLATLPP